ncbi:hypothetical protein RRG08_009920 [Elysia crispata]|uniref:Uncharacterized protein n=1 Tax=Elysia crispata TaxID=231223 RepID=A0AAE1ASJ7_9GAST|nr:hypothetical protein RRG08_009920 [Elysia crispata]
MSGVKPSVGLQLSHASNRRQSHVIVLKTASVVSLSFKVASSDNTQDSQLPISVFKIASCQSQFPITVFKTASRHNTQDSQCPITVFKIASRHNSDTQNRQPYIIILKTASVLVPVFKTVSSHNTQDSQCPSPSLQDSLKS